MPPEDNRARRWLKLLLYLVGAGFGELDAEDATACSETSEPVRLPATAAAEAAVEVGRPSSVKDPRVGALTTCVRGEDARGDDPKGEAERVGVLNGCTEKELLRLAATARRELRELCDAV